MIYFLVVCGLCSVNVFNSKSGSRFVLPIGDRILLCFENNIFSKKVFYYDRDNRARAVPDFS
ncbi:hypothetical protein GOY13_02930 [Wolbachia endosymbiont of Cruorifilaria tuberocauda]|uniref:hypothetical protein n=1 Tax=Wolbachia endosymbiont of Cruorifilaria tuberocauda TaxID=1812111 RepID=UPI00158C0AB5|nr:hypothetical protein [Wolbachia endosymbiont of Cruorifilaria tuberocauda]QKX01859.1 hypothetical protein GOY13_02930 [Wolbachia endosymbiont of Cruorifilaria tuberocauda]